MNNLAILLKGKGDIAGAEELYRRALEGRERILGPEHPDTLTSVYNLARLREKQGDLVEAEVLFRRELQGYELESIVEVHGGPLVVVDLHCAAKDTATELNRNKAKNRNGFDGTVTFRSYGGRAPWEDQLPQSNMFPEEHGHFAVVHEETTPARRVLKERSSSAS